MISYTFTTLLNKVVLGGVVILALSICWVFFPPHHPRNIPSVPFWVTLLPLFFDVDQEETYRKYIQKPLQKHGAIKIFFGGQWNLLIQRSSYMNEIFKNEEIYQKSGNQKKIPHSVFAEFLGDNIISARDENWRLYRNIIQPGLQRTFETEPIVENAKKLCVLLKESQHGMGNRGVSVQEYLQCYTTANISRTLLQTEVESLTTKDASLTKLQLALKKEIFKPIFMNFPMLDRFGTFIPSRTRARELVKRFSEDLETRVLQSHDGNHDPSTSESVGARLIAARSSGAITQKQFRDNLNVTFVAGQENPQLLLISTMYLLGKYPEVQVRLRDEIEACGAEEPSHPVLRELPYLTSVIYESLRLFPPISQLVNRWVAQPVMLGNELYIPKGTYVGYNCYSTNRDPKAWGMTADDFRPERWGATNKEISMRYRLARARAEFISFHGGSRACLGENFALLEMRISLFVLLKHFSWTLDPEWLDRKTPFEGSAPYRLSRGRWEFRMVVFGEDLRIIGTKLLV
ncbi:cytochrome P450-dit2 [Emydomyces testavorans]|uniref:Cytochrome P450-dit2 n=1 Tax=Emydomyces testavorans TaxID=2070801 RepID=A0AAF0IFT8_9EURO|nr:cytochrome P450-dit2 [Emydomyces testavorans]